MSGEAAGLNIAIWQFALNALWVLLPLVPAVVIYLIFPRTQISLSGPFQGLSIRSTGAFAGYLIIFLATYPLLRQMNGNLGGMFRPSWTITGNVVVKDENGQAIDPEEGGGNPLKISLSPSNINLNRQGFRLIVPEIDGTIPTMVFEFQGYGYHVIAPNNPSAGQNITIDHANRTINIRSPLVFQQRPCRGMGC
jgi:hypothetical protein